MIKIGILAPQNSSQIAGAVLKLLKKDSYVVAIKENNRQIYTSITLFENSGVDYLLITLNSKKIYPIELDILIMDNSDNRHLVTYDLIKCVTEKTLLIYNTDNGYLPIVEHPNAIDYGFSSRSSVTVSSINYTLGVGFSFILCIQREITGLFFNPCPIGELLIYSDKNIEISNLLPAVICALICDVVNYSAVKI